MTGFHSATGIAGAWLIAVLLLACAFEGRAQPITRVYRADWRPPSEMFAHGAQGPGNNMDLLAHALGGSCDDPDPVRGSLWVSTVTSQAEASGFAQRQLAAGGAIEPYRSMWIYTIRPDHTYISIPRVLLRVAGLARTGSGGYDPGQASDIHYLLQNTLILPEEEVVTHFISPWNIESAVEVYFAQRQRWMVGVRTANPAFVELATAVGADGPLSQLVPPSSIHRGYRRPGDSSAPASCVMSCDRANTASSRLALAATLDSMSYCSAAILRKRNPTPLVRQLPMIFDFFGSDTRNEEL